MNDEDSTLEELPPDLEQMPGDENKYDGNGDLRPGVEE